MLFQLLVTAQREKEPVLRTLMASGLHGSHQGLPLPSKRYCLNPGAIIIGRNAGIVLWRELGGRGSGIGDRVDNGNDS